MLPGFRFLFAAIVLSMSIVVFGFGAAALLRTAHEEFASTPALYAPPETRFAQAIDTTKPVLALLRVDDAPKDAAREPVKNPAKDAPPEDTSRAEPPASDNAPALPPVEQAAAVPALPQQNAAPQPVDSPPSALAKAEPATVENPVTPDAPPVRAAADNMKADTTKIAATEPATTAAGEPASAAPAETPAAAAIAPVVAEQADRPTSSDIARSQPSDPNISTRIATLGGPPVDIAKEPPVKAASAKPDTGTVKKHEVRREHKRRRIVARARVARQMQRPADPFAVQ